MSLEISNVSAVAPEKAATFINKIAAELKLPPRSVSSTATLLAEGATVPFIARYRKEVTGSLDEVAITGIRDRMGQLVELESRRGAILKSLDERKLLTPQLKAKVDAAETHDPNAPPRWYR